MYGRFACMCSVFHVCAAPVKARRGLAILELEVQTVVRCHTGTADGPRFSGRAVSVSNQ